MIFSFGNCQQGHTNINSYINNIFRNINFVNTESPIENEFKKIILPKNWFGVNNNHLITIDLYSKSWIII